ncbi:xanthine dehydrogenase family protein molybdopterin-binding subunit [Bradyrhizobium sp.]|uniref:xanthine dehydrogenase family protein molybdopterin-binding subunit n=1 Tax=Bradyrhizobium sp. TaxID=376 RepID=UPI000A571FA8|nr:xanthine dehydrogenase family protein molybdopterin-binding subunit [Bradyrhizobium sp.]
MSVTEASHIGRPTNRVDGPLKVTGQARYAAEYPAPDLLYGYLVGSTIAAGRITAIHLDLARSVPGVVEIFTHENRGKAAWLDRSWRDEVAPPGHPFRPLHSERILFDGQPIALVVAETYEAARDAASLIHAEYETAEHCTELERKRSEAYVPPEKRSGIPPPPDPRGDAEQAFEEAPVKISRDYRVNAEHHNPMEMFGTTCVFEGEGRLTIYDKTQGSQNAQGYVTSVFGLKSKNVRVVNHYVGGAFGSGLRPQHQLFFAVMAAIELERSVRVSLTRAQMFHIGYRPDNFQTVSLAADREGRLQSIMHDVVAATSRYEDHQEVVVNWSGMMYHCDNVKLSYRLAKLDTATPCDMRAPGAAIGVTALECALDELSYEVGIDPLEIRRLNFASKDENTDKQFTSKALHACYSEGAAAFGWNERKPEPRSMRERQELIGWGVSTGMWDAFLQKAEARAKLSADGRLEVSTAASDIGTGTWTILTQIGADAFGIPLEDVTARIGDSTLPTSPVEGGSWTAASNGSAVQAACEAVKQTLFKHARKMANSPLAAAELEDVDVSKGRIFRRDDPGRSLTIVEVMHAADLQAIEETGKVGPSLLQMTKYVSYTHSAVFAEVRVDEDLGVVRVTRVVCAVAAGRILNPKTARSQILGGVVMGIGMALHEEGITDHRLGKIMNHNLAEYHIPAHADIEDIDVIFVDEHDDKVSPLGVKGIGEIGIVGTAAAVANAIFHATGKRVRDFPITIDKLIAA